MIVAFQPLPLQFFMTQVISSFQFSGLCFMFNQFKTVCQIWCSSIHSNIMWLRVSICGQKQQVSTLMIPNLFNLYLVSNLSWQANQVLIIARGLARLLKNGLVQVMFCWNTGYILPYSLIAIFNLLSSQPLKWYTRSLCFKIVFSIHKQLF